MLPSWTSGWRLPLLPPLPRRPDVAEGGDIIVPVLGLVEPPFVLFPCLSVSSSNRMAVLIGGGARFVVLAAERDADDNAELAALVLVLVGDQPPPLPPFRRKGGRYRVGWGRRLLLRLPGPGRYAAELRLGFLLPPLPLLLAPPPTLLFSSSDWSPSAAIIIAIAFLLRGWPLPSTSLVALPVVVLWFGR